MNQIVQAQQSKPSLMAKFSERYSVDAAKMFDTLKATAFKQSNGQVPSNEQMMALLVVADQYQLNPFTKEIYAFPDKDGIVPVVGVDGWSRIINSHPAFDGMDFDQDAESCTCTIYRKDRSHPIKVTEWMAECKRNFGPWQSHPRRMLRHKAMIQCARIAFGFVGIFDPDEADRIVERDITPTKKPAVQSLSQAMGERRHEEAIEPEHQSAGASDAGAADSDRELDGAGSVSSGSQDQ